MSSQAKAGGLLRRYYNPALRELATVLDMAGLLKTPAPVVAGLEKVLRHLDLREAYTQRMTSPCSEVCSRVMEETHQNPWGQLRNPGVPIRRWSPTMLTGRLEGQFLKSLVSGQRARRVLDVGMYTGYSALSMAEALPADGELVTLDREPYLQERNRAVFDSVPHGKKITIKIGKALDIMRQLQEEGKQFDFIFLDADKSEHLDYVKVCFEEGLLAENGTVASDNAYYYGHNYLPSDEPLDGIQSFGEHLCKDHSLHKVLVPIRDGVLLIRRLSEVERDLTR